MKWMNRTWLSIIRRPKKTLMLFLVAFAMGNLLAGSLGIITTSETIQSSLKENLGTNVTVSGTFNKNDYYTNYFEKEETIKEFMSILDNLSNDERVISGEYHMFTDGITPTEAGGQSYRLYSTNVSIISDFEDGKKQIRPQEENRFFTDEEISNGEYVVMTDIRLGTETFDGEIIQTGICDVGSKIKIQIPVANQWVEGGWIREYYEFEATVVGTFQSSNRNNSRDIIIPNNTLMKVLEDAALTYKDKNPNIYFELDYAGFALSDLNELENFDAEAKPMIQALGDFEYISSSETYKNSAGPVENLNTIAKVIFIVAVLATILILGLVIVSFIIERKKEMGIYSSLGESQKNILLQITCEILLVASLAFATSSVSGLFLGNKLSDYMLEVQRYVQRQQNLGDIANLPVRYKPFEGGFSASTRDELIDSYEISPNVEYFATLAVVGEITILVSCVLPLAYLTKLKPKDIMI